MDTPRSGAPLALAGATVLLLVATAHAIYDVDAYRWGNSHVGSCLETCCCKVCSSPTAQAYPYGLIDQTLEVNPTAPKVIGAGCRVPTWVEWGLINDTNNNQVTGPDKLFWTDFTVFGDSDPHVSPTTCDCCRVSVDTNCAEEAPIARQPSYFKVSLGGVAMEGQDGAIVFYGGYGLSSLDRAELRNDTHCGYTPPAPVRATGTGVLEESSDATAATWRIPRLPTHGCYRVCYYQQNLTTPGWYHVGDLVVHPRPDTTMSFVVNPHDVLLEGNEVTLTFTGANLLNVFDDNAELRTGGTCGDGAYSVRTSQGGYEGLNVLPSPNERAFTWLGCFYFKMRGAHGTPRSTETNLLPLRVFACRYGDTLLSNTAGRRNYPKRGPRTPCATATL